jgi:type I restriction enzyme R subunit
MPTLEAKARENIDAQLTACGWIIQDRPAMNLSAGQGVAVREFAIQSNHADYLLFVDRKAVGVIEAKKEGIALTSSEGQAASYSADLPENIPHVELPLPFVYESTGVETFFRDNRDPHPRSRRVFTFHRPETLALWVTNPVTLRGYLQRMPDEHPLIKGNLWPAQEEAIRNLEQSFASDHSRALIQMATGSGKTFTAVNFVYRLIKHAKAKRILFLVDRNNLGRQTFKEFDQFVTPDDGRKFSELYNIQHLQSNVLDDVSKVHITTIQRLYSMLSGEAEFDPSQEEGSLWEADEVLSQQTEKDVRYNPRFPIEYYDFIVTDECHRSIYNLWRQVLDYFDAHLIGLTATPSKQTFGFFNQNLVMEYSRQRAVADGVNVDGDVYRIKTNITEHGSTVQKGWWVGKRDKRTRRERWEQLDEDITYEGRDLDRNVSSSSQIRTIIEEYKDSLDELFPLRNEVPKTLIFAKDDNHAEEIVRITREIFGKGNDFCQKITYKTEGVPENIISAFRTSYNPRIAVTVDMIATGTDIKPLEVLIFMRSVRSRILFEQMLGRGTRIVSQVDFQSVTTTPNARKTRYVIVDAVGVTEREMVDTGTVDRKRSETLKSLLGAVAVGSVDEDLLGSLARRLSLMDKQLSTSQRQEIGDMLDVPSAPERFDDLKQLANAMLDAIDTDQIIARAIENGADPTVGPADEEFKAAQSELIDRAIIPLAANPKLRAYLMEREILIDETSMDFVLERQIDDNASARARQLVDSFEDFIQEHKDEITALQIIYNRPQTQKHLDFEKVKELANQLDQFLHETDPLFITEELWQAYTKLEKDRVRGAGDKRILADLVSLVRHAAMNEELVPYPEMVERRYQDWLEGQASQGRMFTPQQRWWLDEIARHIGINVAISIDDLNYFGFQARGGQLAAQRLFGVDLPVLIEQVNSVLSGVKR